MDQHKSSLPPAPRFSAVINDQTSNCSSCKSVEDALINMCVLTAECWKEQAADTLAAAQECTKQQYLLMLGVLLALVVLGPVQTQSRGCNLGGISRSSPDLFSAAVTQEAVTWMFA